ncbi:MAG: hypothetical protein B0W54_18010 [Cellvibrio sp. 79]|nr:MAG: hypothetical protein B0W54_18010 [Cellvibrio sp. 79]
MPIAHFFNLHKASASLALSCVGLLSPVTMADSAAPDTPAEVLKLDELKSVEVLEVRNPAEYNATAPFKTARNNLTVAAQKGTEDVAYNLPIDYQEGSIYNPATGKPDKVNLRAYNGKFIAPAVIMNPGQTVRFNLMNNLPVPKVNCARADMNTPAPPTCFNETNLHSHGLWISPTGNSDNVLLSIDPDVAFEYEYNVPADHPAGTFWYHPHTYGSTAMQVASGMSGALIVKGSRKPTPESNGDVDTLLEPLVGAGGVEEEIKLLQQIPYACFDSKGKIKKTEKGIWICEDGDVGVVENFDLQVGDPDAWEDSGRYTLINGQARARINARAGQVYRWRLIDAGFNETVNLRIREVKNTKNSRVLAGELNKSNIEKTCNGTEVTQFEIASDGLTHQKIIKKNINVLQPGYRSDILFSLPKKGIYCVYDDESTSPAANVSATRENPKVLAIIVAKGNDVVSDQEKFLKDTLIDLATKQFDGPVEKTIVDDLQKLELNKFVPHQDITAAEIAASNQKPVYIEFNLVFSKEKPPTVPTQFLINNSAFQMGRIDQTLTLGAAQTWFLSSKSVNHPFHIHVNPFQIVSIKSKDGKPLDPQYQNLVGTWKDTLFINTDVIVETRTRYERYIGEYVLHCHILEHEDQGMMQSVQVVLPRNTSGGGGHSGHHH